MKQDDKSLLDTQIKKYNQLIQDEKAVIADLKEDIKIKENTISNIEAEIGSRKVNIHTAELMIRIIQKAANSK